MIEIYVFQYKDEVESLKKQLDRLSESDITYKVKEKTLLSLKDLEYKYLAFYEYGRDYIGIEDLMQLYLLKFNILVLSENGICEVFVDENTTEIELNCYKGIVRREIESFIKGESELKDPEVIKIIVNILKKETPFFDVEQILKDKYLLNVLLSMWRKKDLINLLKNFKVKKKDYGKLDFCDELFEFEEDVPLETIYRLMLAQNIYYDAKLYEFLKSDIYPDQEYYYLPMGLKAINYNVDETHLLNKSTLLFVQQMRELMNRKYVICPSSLIRLKGGNDFFKPASIKSLLFHEGLEIMRYDAKDIEILERRENKIIYHDKVTNEIICSDLNGNVASLIIYVPNKNLFFEDYHSFQYAESSFQQCKNIIEARMNAALFSCAYVDVSTKYGNFCLHIEEKNAENQYGSCVCLYLYQGNHNENMDELSNDFNRLVFRTKYIKDNNFYQWMLGSVGNFPFRNICSYYQTKVRKSISNLPIYSFYEYQGNGKRGIICLFGSVKLKENQECISDDIFDNLEFDEYEDIPCNSKAYFGTSTEQVTILKYLSSNNIKIIYKQRNERFGNLDETVTIQSHTNKEFNEYDFEKIVVAIEAMPIHKFLKKFIIDEIKTYISIYFKNNIFWVEEFPYDLYINLSNVLMQHGYTRLVDILDTTNSNEFVEKLIESIIQIFHISLDELLSQSNQKEIEERVARKLIKKTNK